MIYIGTETIFDFFNKKFLYFDLKYYIFSK